MPAKASILDDRLSQYLNHLWLDDINVTYAGHTLSAFRRFYPQLRFRLPVAKQFFSNWKSIYAPRQAVPMPAVVALALAGVAFQLKEFVLGLQFLIGFTAFLRTGEITNLHPSHFQVFPDEGHIILALPATKTSRQRMESVEIHDPLLASLAAAILHSPHAAHLGSLTPSQFRNLLRRLLTFLQLSSLNLSGYSLRRGGASHAFANGQHFDSLLVRGRWQSVRTARQYLDSGRAALVQLTMPDEAIPLVNHFQVLATKFCEQLRQKRPSLA